MSRALRRAQARQSRPGATGAGPVRAIPRATAVGAGTRDAGGRGGLLGWRPRFAMDVISELRKVVWPTREDTMYLTVVVVIVTLILGALLGAIDIGFGWLIDNTLLR